MPLPYVVSPTTSARSWSCSAPAMISAALAVPRFTRTTIGNPRQRWGAPSDQRWLSPGALPRLIEDILAWVEEEIGGLDSLVSEAARIGAQVEQQRLHPLPGQARDLLLQLPGAVLAHHRQRQVSDAVGQQQSLRDRALMDPLTGEAMADGRLHALAAHRQVDRRADRAAQRLHRPLHRPVGRGDAVHLDELIPGADAGPLAGRAGHGRDDGDPAVPGVDLEADAAVVTGGPFLQPLIILPGEQRGVGIVQLLEDPVDRPVVELALGKRVDLVVPHVLEHLLEQAGLLIDVVADSKATLQEPAAGEAGDERHQGGNGPPSVVMEAS